MSEEMDRIVAWCDCGLLSYDKQANVFYFNGEELVVRYAEGNYAYVKGLPVHRIIAYLKFGDAYLQPGIEARHLNNDKHDHTWDNISIGTHKQNMHDLPYEFWDELHAKSLPQLIANLSENSKHYWNSLTEEQRSARIEQIKQISLRREANLSDEFKSERAKKGWLKKSRVVVGKSLSDAHKRRDAINKADPIAFYNQRKDNELTLEQVHEITRLQANGGYTYDNLATMYHVHYNTIEKIINRKSRYKYRFFAIRYG